MRGGGVEPVFAGSIEVGSDYIKINGETFKRPTDQELGERIQVVGKNGHFDDHYYKVSAGGRYFYEFDTGVPMTEYQSLLLTEGANRDIRIALDGSMSSYHWVYADVELVEDLTWEEVNKKEHQRSSEAAFAAKQDLFHLKNSRFITYSPSAKSNIFSLVTRGGKHHKYENIYLASQHSGSMGAEIFSTDASMVVFDGIYASDTFKKLSLVAYLGEMYGDGGPTSGVMSVANVNAENLFVGTQLRTMTDRRTVLDIDIDGSTIHADSLGVGISGVGTIAAGSDKAQSVIRLKTLEASGGAIVERLAGYNGSFDLSSSYTDETGKTIYGEVELYKNIESDDYLEVARLLAEPYILPKNSTVNVKELYNERRDWTEFSADAARAAIIGAGGSLVELSKGARQPVIKAGNDGSGSLAGEIVLANANSNGWNAVLAGSGRTANPNADSVYKSRFGDFADIDLKISGFVRDVDSIDVEHKLVGIDVFSGKMLTLGGDIGSDEEYLELENGIYGAGGVFMGDGGSLHLGGENTFKGALTAGLGALVQVKDSNAVKGAESLVLKADSTFKSASSLADKTWKSVVIEGGSGSDSGASSRTVLEGAGAEKLQINASGADSHIAVFQNFNSAASDEADAASGPAIPEARVKHHLVDVVNVELNVLDGASLWINSQEGVSESSGNAMEMAVLRIGGGSTLNISGKAPGADSSASSHMYLGNGIVQVEDGGRLVLGSNSAIHFSSHMPGFFEWNESQADPHHHASIELAAGSSAKLVFDEHNHIYSDKIQENGHQHYLLGADWQSRQAVENVYYFSDDRRISVQMTQEVLAKLKAGVDNEYVDAKALSNFITAVEAVGVDLTQEVDLHELKTKLQNAGVSEANFHAGLSAVMTASMDNRHHSSWQEYSLRSDVNGIYMTVEKTNAWEDVTKIRLSLHKETNEVVRLAAEGSDRIASLEAESGAYQVIDAALSAYTLGMDVTEESFRTAARVIDSAGQLATVGGSQTLAWDMLQNRRDSISRHQNEALYGEESRLWADLLTMNNKSSGMWNDLNGDRSVDADINGIVVGADANLASGWNVGAALAYMDGDADTTLGMSEETKTRNKVSSASATIYASRRVSDDLTLKLDAGYQWGGNDLTMTFPGAVFGADAKSLTANVDTHSFQINAVLEYKVRAGENAFVVPFAGIGYTHLRTEEYTSKLSGLTAFRTEASKQNIASVPLGVRIEGEARSGKAVFKPRAAVYVQPNLGSIEANNMVHGHGLESVDHVRPEVIGRVSWGASIGTSVMFTDSLAGGLDFRYNGSDKSDNTSFTASLRYSF